MMAERTAWRICPANGWFLAFGNKPRQGKRGKAGPQVHDDLVRRDFTADAPNQSRLCDITEHRTTGGKPYVCAVKDVFSNRIVGHLIDSQMTSRIAVKNAVTSLCDIAGCVPHTKRG